ncbi:MAG: peptidase T [Clostridiales bacterium]|uniref:Peptidase T n=1 Tax=Harryflintia acetispora TaxID=1849041 RepID=A0A9X8UJC3_9FIRM|nr:MULTISPECIES: peptidase T [Oscillospiraceae]PWM34660.1 MAG: peptidase T [Clostridiales bacterium]RGB65174.1 peptidase T [Harryflintia acetispora]TCL42833.1 tripeptide aminopeptidase [Harryflintia acetispora]
MSNVTERFLKYISFDTQSLPEQDCFPSTEKQKALGEELVREMKELGIADARMDDNGYVMGTIPATVKRKGPVLGLIAHMDTSPDISGEDIRPRIVKDYDGGDIVLNGERGIVLRREEFESLGQYVGQDLIVTDGTTLLGSDDKAGVAEIMQLAEILMAHPELPHGPLKIAFTPDEEVGRGADFFDVKAFGADVAFTVDGGVLGELSFETFNAADAKVQISGVNIHPGSAKHKMKNSILIGMEFHSMLPPQEAPAFTEGYEGFYHLEGFEGSVERTRLHYIVRDHDRGLFEKRKHTLQAIADYLNEKYGAGTVNLVLRDSYYNMREKIEPHFELIEAAKAAMVELGITPIVEPTRGGTDGSRLSYMGLPCPNICAGGHNMHGRYEYISVQSMEKIVELLLRLVTGQG